MLNAPNLTSAVRAMGTGGSSAADPGHTSLLLGRETERRAIDAVIDAARNRMSRTLVLRGEPGMGKTALISYAASATDLTRLSVGGVEAESNFAFAGLHRLVSPLLHSARNLPRSQRTALEVAFGLATGPRPDQYLVALAVLTLLAGEAGDHGLLCLVDDAQWLDMESVSALGIVARRLHADGIAILVGLRDSGDRTSCLNDLDNLEVGHLRDEDAQALLAHWVGRALDPLVTRRIIDETQGCPLALLELARDLTDAELEWLALAPQPLPLGRRLEAHFLRRVRLLPAATQILLLIAAADASGDEAMLHLAALALDVPADADAPAVDAGLLDRQVWLRFRHPLVRSAVYNGASTAQRRQVHAALAAATSRGTAPDRYAWHRSAASAGPDGTVAAELELAAGFVRDRGGRATEVIFLARAGELSPDRGDRARRLLNAAQAAIPAGLMQQASRLIEEVTAIAATPALRAEAQRVQATLDLLYGRIGDTAARYLAAARTAESADAHLARDIYTDAIQAALGSAQLTRRTSPAEIARAALAVPPSSAAPHPSDLLRDALATRVGVGYMPAIPLLRSAVDSIREADPAMLEGTMFLAQGSYAALELWDLDAAREILTKLAACHRARGELNMLRMAMCGLCIVQVWAGDFGAAAASRAELLSISAAIDGGPGSQIWQAFTSELPAWQGRDEQARNGIALLTGELTENLGMGQAINMGLLASASLAAARGQYEEALSASWLLFNRDFPPNQLCLPGLVEAAVYVGDNAKAQAGLARLEERATASKQAWGLGLLARSRALVADGQQSEPFFTQAVRLLAEAGVRTDLARTHLLYGEWLRRRKRRSDARQELQTALDMFSQMGAHAFADRTRGELEATGVRAQATAPTHTTELTPREDQVARQAAQGDTDAQIAMKLFLSANTVDYHLRKVYRKLGINSRRDLRSVLPLSAPQHDHGPPEPQAWQVGDMSRFGSSVTRSGSPSAWNNAAIDCAVPKLAYSR